MVFLLITRVFEAEFSLKEVIIVGDASSEGTGGILDQVATRFFQLWHPWP